MKIIDKKIDLLMPVIIYQMGKVASSTIVKTLKNSGYTNVYQPHRILEKNIIAHKEKAEKSRIFPPLVDEEGSLINRYNLLEGAKVISLVREPIERNFSAFFENYQMMTGNDFQKSDTSIEVMINKFLENYPHQLPTEWFEQEFNQTMNIDIYDYPFDKEKGYSIYKLEKNSVLIMRSELNDKKKEQALQIFLNDKNIKITNANVSSTKIYNDAYKEFKQQIVLPSEYIDKMYNSKYVKHFYTEQEIDAFRKKWSKET